VRLSRLQQDIETGLAPLGWPKEKRPYKGHLTLARAKGRRPFERHVRDLLVQCEPDESAVFIAEKLTLYRSRLQPGGAVYDKISQRVLSGEAS
jgi:2'-5' RNA ligase